MTSVGVYEEAVKQLVRFVTVNQAMHAIDLCVSEFGRIDGLVNNAGLTLTGAPWMVTPADVDRVVTGTLLRAGDQLRVVAQLVEAPSGTLLTSQTVQSSLGDLFRLQDDIARRLVNALSLPLTGASTPLAHDDFGQ